MTRTANTTTGVERAEDRLPKFRLRCPVCDRDQEPTSQHCPWDGASLAGGLPMGREGMLGETPGDPDKQWPGFYGRARVTGETLEQMDLPVDAVDYAAVGAGLGSFAWTDALRVRGVEAVRISVLGPNKSPHGHYGFLAHNSQIPDHERIRSNSESTPDNLWGWPGYAAREAAQNFACGRPGAALGTLWQIFGEPTLAQTYTPKLGDVLRSVDREAARIGWDRMAKAARVHAIRKTSDGRYAVLYSRADAPSESTAGPDPVYGLLLARHVHLAVGYPGLRVLESVRRHREATGDLRTVVNAYEDHGHVYESLRRRGGRVLLRGRGIVASRVLQRLYEERRHNPNITVTHLMRSPRSGGHRYGRSRREVLDHFEFQPFNWPRGAWGGEQRARLERAAPEERKELLEQWGGTTTARRRDWVEILEEGLSEGWYRAAFGEVERFEFQQEQPGERPVVAYLWNDQPSIPADYVIDATGLETSLDVNPLLGDLVQTYGLEPNPLGQLSVEDDFEVLGMRNGEGRLYAAGAMTLGGPYAGVDTFLGLQYAALRSADALTSLGAPGLRGLNSAKSALQWTRWALGVAP